MRIGIATSISGLNFSECYPAGISEALDDVEVKVIGLSHLKVNKRAVARHKDLDDLENLP